MTLRVVPCRLVSHCLVVEEQIDVSEDLMIISLVSQGLGKEFLLLVLIFTVVKIFISFSYC